MDRIKLVLLQSQYMGWPTDPYEENWRILDLSTVENLACDGGIDKLEARLTLDQLINNTALSQHECNIIALRFFEYYGSLMPFKELAQVLDVYAPTNIRHDLLLAFEKLRDTHQRAGATRNGRHGVQSILDKMEIDQEP